MTRNDMAAAQGRIRVAARDPAAARFSVQVLSTVVRRYLEPGAIGAMIRYWSRFGVGSFAQTFDRDRTAARSYPCTPSATASACLPGEDDGR
ncbi:MAG TPA: hypothetical protein VK162_26015 [Streptosporangiaceae bacterium]|nr:hypothetical protein [Streptosporangiaceae bacterium]